jgi:Cys-tRNA(Pro) deacylase
MKDNQKRFPTTQATIFLDKLNVDYRKFSYIYRKSGAVEAAQQMGVDSDIMIKTLIMEDEAKNPFIVLMQGDRRVSLKKMAQVIGSKNVSSCHPKDAQRYTGYVVGGISPFGTRRKLPVFLEKSIMSTQRVFLNGGRRGFLVELSTDDLVDSLNPKIVDVAV